MSKQRREEASPPGPEETWAAEYGDYRSSYRYLRLAIVAVVITLLLSIILERAHAKCWNGSISAYYYTPVHSIFVAALGVIGVALFVIRGGTLLEEALLNGAAFLAPIVAFVPTGWSATFCPSNLSGQSASTVDSLLKGNQFFHQFTTNNLVAFVLGGIIAVTVTMLVTMIWKNQSFPPKEIWVPALGSAVVVIVGIFWHLEWPGNFSTHAHSYSAILMFVLVGFVMLSTAIRNQSPLYRAIYFACAGAMVVGGGAVAIAGALTTWRHQILILEMIEIGVFVIFWFLQTIQLWDVGLAPLEGSTRRT